jgi:hypothetical protein
MGGSQWAVSRGEERSASKVPKRYGKYLILLLEAGLIEGKACKVRSLSNAPPIGEDGDYYPALFGERDGALAIQPTRLWTGGGRLVV